MKTRKLLKHLVFVIALIPICFPAYPSEGDDPNPTYTPRIMPASPTASELGKYGYIPVGLSTGIPNIGIPLYDYTARNLTVPLSLSYHCNGIKVDQLSSWVGMGWSLNAGGVVTRTIRDEADDMSYRVRPPDSYYPSWQLEDYLHMCSDENDVDSEPDIFSFNFNGYSGTFIFDKYFEPKMITHQNLKIETDYLDSTSMGIQEITITDGNGIVYIFGGSGNVETSRDASTGSCGRIFDDQSITSWYLSKIKHPLGDSILFSYSSKQYYYTSGVSQTFQEAQSYFSDCDGTCVGKGERICYQRINVKTLHLTQIDSPGYGKIVVSSIDDRPDIDTANPQMESRLSKIMVYDEDNNEIKSFDFIQLFSDENSGSRMFLDSIYVNDPSQHEQSYDFEYNKDIDDLPARLSMAQDHWGFYNGKDDNSYYVPYPGDGFDELFDGIGSDKEPNSIYSDIGLLKKITYPTGGHNLLEYEANTYNDDVVTYTNDPEEVSLSVTSGPNSTVTSDTIFINFDQIVQINSTMELDVADTTQHNKVTIKVYDITDAEYIVDMIYYPGEPYESFDQVAEGHAYLVSLTAGGFEPGDLTAYCTVKYDNGTSQIENQNIETGGTRIKKIIAEDLFSDEPQTTYYYYTSLADRDKSKGQLNHEPIYYRIQEIYYSCAYPISQYSCNYVMLSSNSVTNLYDYGSNFINYSHVLVSHGEEFENGGEEHAFKVSPDAPGNLIKGNHITGTPFNNSGWDNGLELFSRTFKNDDGVLTTLQKKYNYYVVDERMEDEHYGVVVRKNWDALYTHTQDFICPDDPYDESNILRATCDVDHDHFWVIGGGWRPNYKNPYCLGGNYNDTTWLPCHGYSGDTLPYTPELENFDIMQYSVFSNWSYLNRDSTVTYDQGGDDPVSVVNRYYYDNEIHANLTRSITTDSRGDTLKSFFYYPQDYNEGAENFEYLVENNIINVPIDQRTYKNEVLTSGKLTEYSDIGQALEVYMAKSELGAPLAFDASDPYSYGIKKISLDYDGNGNIKEYCIKDDEPKSFIWGYNNKKPIAKVQNSTIEECYHENFEETTNPYSSDKHTGSHSLKLTQGNFTGVSDFNKSDLVSGKYVYSAWVKTLGSNVNAKLIVKDNINYYSNSITDTKGEWEYFEAIIDITSGTWSNEIRCEIQNSSSDDILVDDIRFHPLDAQMTTYTYDPMIGVTSISDVNSLPVHYGYDPFGRLKCIKNHDGDILEQYDYNYKNSF